MAFAGFRIAVAHVYWIHFFHILLLWTLVVVVRKLITIIFPSQFVERICGKSFVDRGLSG